MNPESLTWRLLTAEELTNVYLNEMRRDAMELSPLSKARMLSLRLSWNELLRMYYKYVGVLGSSAPVYRFEAVWHGRAVRTVVREPVQSVRLECTVHNPLLTDGPTWDCAAVSLRAIDQNGNLLPYCGEAVCLSVEGPLKILGPAWCPAGRHGGHLPCHHRRGRTRRAALPHGGCTGHGGGCSPCAAGRSKNVLIFVLSW